MSFTPIPDGRLLVLTADASTFSVDLHTGRCSPDSRFRRGFRVGRAVTFHEPSATLLIAADGRATASAAPGTHCAAARSPSLAAWSLKSGSGPRFLASIKGARTEMPSDREFWRVQLSPDGRVVGVCESGLGWSIMAGPEAKFEALQVQREDAGEAARVTALVWEDATNALVGWSDGRVFRLDFEAMTSFYVPMRDVGVVLEEGSAMAWAFAAASNAGDADGGPRLAVLEAAWEDGAVTAEVQCRRLYLHAM